MASNQVTKALFILPILALTKVDVVAVRLTLERNSDVLDGQDMEMPIIDQAAPKHTNSGNVVAIFLDYDGCSDFLNPLLTSHHSASADFFARHKKTEQYKHEREKMISFLKDITRGAERVILFVGSNRQSLQIDKVVGQNPGGFNAIKDGAYDAIAEQIGKEVSGKPWELNHALLADLNMKRPDMQSAPVPDGEGAWTDPSKECSAEFLYRDDPENELDVKWMMVQNNMKQLKGMDHPVKVFYIDDKDKFLKRTAHKFSLEKRTGFANWGRGYDHIHFITAKFDYMDYIIDGKDEPIRMQSHGEAGDVVAIFLDYDGCSDFLNPLLTWEHHRSAEYFAHVGKNDQYKHEREKMISFLKDITRGAEDVILFVGSNRQSLRIDDAYGRNPGDFNAIKDGAYDAIADQIGKEVSGKPWELNHALLADLNMKRPDMQSAPVPDGEGAWTDPSKKCSAQFLQGDPENELDVKWMMVQNNMKQLKGMDRPVKVFYIDDRDEFLKHTGKKFSLEKRTGFANWGRGYDHIHFITVEYDYMDYIAHGKDELIRVRPWD